MKLILLHLKWPAMISSALVLPFIILELVNRHSYREGFPIPLFGILWLLPLAHWHSACSPVSTGGVGTVVPEHALTRIAQTGDTAWDLVALGNSTPTGYGVAAAESYVQVYAQYIEQDLLRDAEVTTI